MQTMERQELLTVEETARILRLGRTRTNEILWSGALRSVKIGRRLIRRADLERFISENECAPGEIG